MKTLFIGFAMMIPLLFTSCSDNNQKNNQEEVNKIYIVNHADDVGKHGNGTYINMNTEYKDRDGVRWSKDNIFAPGPGESLSDEKFQRRSSQRRSSGGNQYGKGYEQGQEDARRGLRSDPDKYNGNGQFNKGYEDGYEDW